MIMLRLIAVLSCCFTFVLGVEGKEKKVLKVSEFSVDITKKDEPSYNLKKYHLPISIGVSFVCGTYQHEGIY